MPLATSSRGQFERARSWQAGLLIPLSSITGARKIITRSKLPSELNEAATNRAREEGVMERVTIRAQDLTEVMGLLQFAKCCLRGAVLT